MRLSFSFIFPLSFVVNFIGDFSDNIKLIFLESSDGTQIITLSNKVGGGRGLAAPKIRF